MKITLLKDEKLLTYKLPDKIDGNYWLSEIDSNGLEKNIINVEASQDNKWILVSNSDYFVTNNSNRVANAVLVEDNFYYINHAYSLNNILMFTSPNYEYKMKFYSCTKEINNGINIGKNNSCNIIYDFIEVGDIDFFIKSEIVFI